MRIKLTIEYDGSGYAGWQRQKNGLSVQQVVEEAIAAATGQQTVIYAAGRTDAGVHALGQVAHFDTQTTIPPEKISYALNTFLPEDIRIASSCEVSEDFHSRFGAKAKTYVYTFYNSEHASALYRNLSAHARGDISIDAMKKAAKKIVGTHDFASFCASGSEVETTVRTVYSLEIVHKPPLIKLEITGSGFLYNMVRIIAGVLLDVGKGKLSPEDVEKIMAEKDRRKASATAPACGLVLKQIYYGDEFQAKP